ncbi:MAG TPA: hypothetical protein VKU40_17870, partial [Thermoanaerobaculia bacterium]|nr:hypothetical protein [Thermoanaerobaculia bacterium]
LPAAGRDRLRRYLAALAEGDAPAAAEAFAAACGPLAPETAATLVRRLCQTAAFREAGWTGCEGLAGEMLAHQRTAVLLGGRPDAAFTAFFAAVAATAVATLSLVPAGAAPDPASDPAADALRAVAWERRLAGFFAGFADQLAPRRLGAAALSNALAAGELPGKLDRALDRLADGGFEVRVTAPPPAPGNAWLPALASVVVLAGVALAAAPLAAAFGAWGEGAITLAVAATGAALLLPSRRRPNRPPAHEPRGDRR